MIHTFALTVLFIAWCNSAVRAADCNTTQVASGDTCATLAGKCGISADDFAELNKDPQLCSSLLPGQHICCSPGELPDLSPRKQADGTCATHVVADNEHCAGIAATNSITSGQIESFNKGTWGWMGCDFLEAGFVLCLSDGSPPMPANIPSAVCGTQVNGTTKPSDMEDLWKLNPCPLNACCDIWGQCGITEEFCNMTQSPTGAPGTAANGTNGCISNCGTTIINNAVQPSEFKAV